MTGSGETVLLVVPVLEVQLAVIGIGSASITSILSTAASALSSLGSRL
jgi:hypothetical protein